MIIPVGCFSCGKVVGDKWEQRMNMTPSRPDRETFAVSGHNAYLSSATLYKGCTGYKHSQFNRSYKLPSSSFISAYPNTCAV
ncbi:hypothetical protein BJ742DRAFT_333518 [Cladochytrium replicatum]|nr:hypothetical protein BJ742DRAFT_333518 [Cladochytrium replicatum]